MQAVCDIITRNERARNNGDFGEFLVEQRFKGVKYIGDLVDYLWGDKFLEVKTCEEWQKNGRYRCRGRFVLEKQQHEFLIKNDGLYVFVVLKENGGYSMFVRRARDIGYKRKICWTKIVGLEGVNT